MIFDCLFFFLMQARAQTRWPEGWEPEGWRGPNFRAFISLSRCKIRSFLPSLGVFFFFAHVMKERLTRMRNNSAETRQKTTSRLRPQRQMAARSENHGRRGSCPVRTTSGTTVQQGQGECTGSRTSCQEWRVRPRLGFSQLGQETLCLF